MSTSDNYHHLLPISSYFIKKYWGVQVELIGYKTPENLPENFVFYSMGTQGDVKEWSTDLRKYFQNQDQWFIWIMEDTFIKRPVNDDYMSFAHALTYGNIGRIDLTRDIKSREHTVANGVIYAHPSTKYRLSTQPSIWNKDFLLKYMTDGLSPWDFETQPTKDEFNVVGLVDYPIIHNEGVRRFDINKFNFDGVHEEDLKCLNFI
jgi:hypothetical protein